MALTELAGTELGTQTIVIEQGPVRAFARRCRTIPTATPARRAHPGHVAVRHELLGLDRVRAAPPACRSTSSAGPGRMILHGEQEFEVHRSPKVGETLTGTSRIADVYEKDTSSATMEFYVRETDWRDEHDQPVVTERFTMIVRAKKG